MNRLLYRDHSQWLMAMEPRLSWLKLTRAQFRKMAAAVGLLFGFFAFILLTRMAVIKNGYAIVELRQDRDRCLAERRKEERRLRELQSLAHAEQVARRDLGMVDVSPNQVVYLSDPAAPLPARAWRAVFGE